MNTQGIAYVLFGLALVVLFGIIIAYYYSGRRKQKIEGPKYKIFDDDE